MRHSILTILAVIPFLGMSQTATVIGQQKVSDTQGNFTAPLVNTDRFGSHMDGLGDLDGDGVNDIIAGSDGYSSQGGAYILFMNSNGTVKSHQLIASGTGGFTGSLGSGDDFGYDVANIGDLNKDGITDVAISSEEDPDGGSFSVGAVWICFLDSNGTVKSQQKISKTQGNFSGGIGNGDRFGNAIAAIGDLDKDGNPDLAVGALFDDDGGSNRGAVYVLFLNTNGTVKSYQKISDTQGNFTATLGNGDYFGSALAGIGDLNNDGTLDIASGAYLDDDGGTDKGAFYVLFMNTNGTVSSFQKVSDTQGGFTGIIGANDYWASSLDNMGDIDGDGVDDIVVGHPWDDDGGSNYGAVWTLYMNTNGTVKGHQKVSVLTGGFTGPLTINNVFGNGVANIGDLNNDGKTDMCVGSGYDDDGGTDRGAIWILNLNGKVNFNAGIAAQTNATCPGGCDGQATAQPIGGVGPFSYNWSTGGTQATDTGLCAGTYTVQIIDGGTSDTSTAQVTITDPAPFAGISGTNVICAGNSTTLTGSGGGSYSWSTSSTTAAITVSPPTTTNYTVVVTDVNSCVDSATVTVTVNPTYNRFDTVTVCQGASHTFHDGFTMNNIVSATSHLSSLQTVGPLCDSLITTQVNVTPLDTSVNKVGAQLTAVGTGQRYQWVTCPGYTPLVNDTNQVYTAPSNGSYAVIVTNGACSDTSACYTVTGVGVDKTESVGYRVFPNPGEDYWKVTGDAPFRYSLMDVSGRLITTSEYRNTHRILVPEFDSGVYILRCEDYSGTIRTLKLLKK